jgi:hypothetical protein
MFIRLVSNFVNVLIKAKAATDYQLAMAITIIGLDLATCDLSGS